MAKRDKRFQVIRREAPAGGSISIGMETVILVDTLTGVLYLQVVNGYGGGLTPLLDRDGKPVIWDSAQPLEEMD